MNLNAFIPVISKVIGRDLEPDVNLFYRARASIGTALNPQAQKFFIENWRTIVDYMESPAGQEAIVEFIGSWVNSMVPKEVGNVEPEPKEIKALPLETN